ncbi:MAG TPA: Gfo/Idh/MocA family oxidoreductase [Phycisphaerales bacterium]|nr:Gfo/Idh/MocA family oxidoreductase [Phycisphaerales bacterium]
MTESSNVLDRRGFLVQAAGAATAVAIMPVLGAMPRLAETLPVVLVGAGRQGRAILTELDKFAGAHVSVAAIVDTDKSRLDGAVRRVQGAQGFASHGEAIEKLGFPGAWIVATPTHTHRAIATDLLAANKNVYCETPLAHTEEDARAILDAARKSSGVFVPALEGRCNPIYRLARTFFRSDSVRDLISMRAQSHQKTSWRTPASDPSREKALNWRLDKDLSLGLPGEIGMHQFDVFCWYRDSYPTSVRASGGVLFHKDGREVADTISCDFAWDDGTRLHYDATLANSYQGKHEILHGSNAAIKLAWSHGWMFKESDAPTQGWEVYANRQQFHNDEGITLIADATKLASQGKLKEGVGLPNPPLYYALEEFIKACGAGAKPAVTPEHGYRATLLGILAQRALVTGDTIRITKEMLA